MGQKLDNEAAGRLYDTAVEHHRRRQFPEALEILDVIISAYPEMATLHTERASILYAMKRFDEAVASYQMSLAIDPFNAEAQFGKGASLQAEGKLVEAVRSYNEALNLQPTHALALNNKGLALRDCGLIADAILNYDAAIDSMPQCPDFYFGKAMCHLLLGQFKEGWSLYEWRKSNIMAVAPPPHGSRPWQGEDLGGKNLLVQAEQGLGDTIQFCRFASLANAEGANVILQVQDRLVRLLQTLSFPVRVVGTEAALSACDYHIMLLSMPHRFGSVIPTMVPYLAAEPEKVLVLQTRLDLPGFKIGISWQGESVSGEKENLADVGRSFALSLFEKISLIPNVRLISLQKNYGVEQMSHLPKGMVVQSLGEAFDSGPHSFLDTAAVIEHVDLIITADTAIAHLAGAMGCPVWLALKYVPDWRWLLDRDDTPWYPTMRLFRQQTPGDWADVFSHMEEALRSMITGRRNAKGFDRTTTMTDLRRR